jgi:hypothetical protein
MGVYSLFLDSLLFSGGLCKRVGDCHGRVSTFTIPTTNIHPNRTVKPTTQTNGHLQLLVLVASIDKNLLVGAGK